MKIWFIALSVCTVLGLGACDNNKSKSHDANQDSTSTPAGQNNNK